jgi:hypothetical protein
MYLNKGSICTHEQKHHVRLKLPTQWSSVFFEKEHILILRRYQLHLASATTLCPDGIKDAHSKKEKNYKKKSLAIEIENLKQQH